MADFAGIISVDSELTTLLAGEGNNMAGWPTIAGTGPGTVNGIDIVPEPHNLVGTRSLVGATPTHNNAPIPGILVEELRDEWIDKIHVIPRSVLLGNIITDQTFVVELYNAFLDSSKQYDVFANNADVGITDITSPPLSAPQTMAAKSGIVLTFNVAASGAAVIDGTLDFTFTEVGGTPTLYTSFLPVSGQRLILFAFRPEVPVKETLQFLSTVHEHLDGSEQRIAKRKNPRQLLNYRVTLDDDDRQALDMMLFNWHPRVFGVPIWWEPSNLTATATVGQTSITLDNTDYGDFRVGELAVIFTDRFTFDVVEILTVTTTAITFVSPLLNNFTVGTEVFPVRTASLTGAVPKPKRRLNVQDFVLDFTVNANDANLADASAFNTFNGAVLLDGPNFSPSGTVNESWDRQITVIDNDTGKISVQSRHSFGRLLSNKGFFTSNRQALWELRQLLHHFKGKVVSFYVPSFFKELTPNASMVSGNNILSIVNVGYSSFVSEADPKKNIKIHLVSGTILDRVITGSSQVDSTTEQLVLDGNWPSNLEPEDIARIEWLDRVRIDSDSIDIFHNNALGEASVNLPVKAVFES